MQREPKNWVEPANLRRALGVEFKSVNFWSIPAAKDENKNLFRKSDMCEYEVKAASDVIETLASKHKAKCPVAVVWDDGIFGKTIVMRGGKPTIVDPHSTKAAIVTETDWESLETELNRGAMLCVISQ